MSSNLNKKFSELLGKMDDKVLKAKLNAAMEMLSEANKEELAKKIDKIDKNEVLAKLNEINDEKLKSLNLNKKELKEKLNSVDMDAVEKMLGAQGPMIMKKIKDIIN